MLPAQIGKIEFFLFHCLIGGLGNSLFILAISKSVLAIGILPINQPAVQSTIYSDISKITLNPVAEDPFPEIINLPEYPTINSQVIEPLGENATNVEILEAETKEEILNDPDSLLNSSTDAETLESDRSAESEVESNPEIPRNALPTFPLQENLNEPVAPNPTEENPTPEMAVSPRVRDRNQWFVTVFGGTGTNSTLTESLLFQNSPFYDSFFNDESFVALEIGRELIGRKVALNVECSAVRGTSCGLRGRWNRVSSRSERNFSIEWLGQMRQHAGTRNYSALETALVARLRLFPGNNFLHTSLAVGNGISYVSEFPSVEQIRERAGAGKLNDLLNFLLIEATFALPSNPNLDLVLRLNHRSGVFGLYNGVTDGSNNYAIGIRQRF